MAKRKFGALADFRQLADTDGTELPTPEAAEEIPAEVSRPTQHEPARGRGRPPGKRSNPEWKLYSHFLKKQTQRQVAARLAAMEDERDLSDVLQELLEQWLEGKRQ